MRIATWLGAVAFTLGLVVQAAPADDKAKAFTDADFVMKAGTGGMHEIEMGKLAKTNAASLEVKGFGERMIKDHTTLGDWLHTAAKAAKIDVPAKLTAEQQKELDKFSKLKGAEFDKEFMAHQVKDHEHDVAEFERASKEAKDPNIKAFAAKALPTLRQHLEHAKKVNANLSKGGR